MDIIEFQSQKIAKENLLLDNNIIESLIEIFDNKIKINSFKNKPINILKGIKVQNSKDNISNKVNLILNKLSESNINNLLIEFITTINQVNENDFNEILKTFYIKIISEINFIKIYIEFFKKIIYIYEKVQNYNITYFINIIETKFKMDYCNYNINDEYNYLSNLQEEDKRINNLILITNLVNNNLLSSDILEECFKLLLSQNKYIIDIYKWIEINNIKVNNELAILINKILNSDNISVRDKILLESLTHSNISDVFKLECFDVINSHIDSITSFVNLKCKDAITKNKFCNNIFEYYLIHNNDIFSILNNLLTNKIILKSNIIKGYNLLNKDNDNIKNFLSKL
jgi:hypothetical protein